MLIGLPGIYSSVLATHQGLLVGHALPFPLPWGRGSVGYFADQTAERLIVFVHGFGGGALKTWKGMEALLELPEVQATDVIFYGYGSLAAPARNSATLFRKFLASAAMLERPWRTTLSRGGAIGVREYKDILIVAHSLGAVVVRRALLDSVAERACWVERTRILLFGPAHMGTRLVNLSLLLRSGIGSILSDFFIFGRMKVPVLDDLEEGSDFLRELLEESEAVVEQRGEQSIRAEAVIFGERDNVVRTRPFCVDPLSDVWPGEDHCSVCRAPQTVYEVARYL